jgi:hypothetical protein
MTQSRDAKTPLQPKNFSATPLHVTVLDSRFRQLEAIRTDQQDALGLMLESHIINAQDPNQAATDLAEQIANIVGRVNVEVEKFGRVIGARSDRASAGRGRGR